MRSGIRTAVIRRLALLYAATFLAGLLLGSPLGVRLVNADGIFPGATFNLPTGETYDQNAILRRMTQAIDGTPSGETIRMAFFSLTVPRFVDKLIAAHRRGVNVRMLQDDHEVGPEWQRLIATIGSDTSKRSWGLLCHRSCHSDEDPSYLHAKLYMFSRTLATPQVVMVSSANPTFTQARVGWNDLYTITRNSAIYTGARTYFERMTAGALQDRRGDQSSGVPIDQYFTVTSGKYKLYFFPKGGEGWDDDPVYGILSNISCRTTASGYGVEGRTTIKIAMYQWSTLRVRLAEKLWELDDRGCIVEVIYSPPTTDSTIVAALTKSGGRYGGAKLVKAFEDRNFNGVPEHFVHNKYLLVNGVYAGDTSSKIVFTGSANWTNTALHYGNEIMLKVADNATYDAYHRQWGRLLAWAKTIPTSPPPTPSPTVRPSPTPTRPPSPPPTIKPSVPPTIGPTIGPTLPPTTPPTAAPSVPAESIPPPPLPALGAPSESSADAWSYEELSIFWPEEELPTDWE